MRGEDDGVFAEMGHGAVTADSFDDDFDRIDIGEGVAFDDADGAMGHVGGAVEGDGFVWAWKFLKEARAEHEAGSEHAFFCGLTNHDEGAAPEVLHFGQDTGCSDEGGHVDVMPAGVHDADFAPEVVLDGFFAGVVGAGLLGDGEGIEVGADEDGGAIAIFEDADKAMAADFFGHLESGAAELAGDAGGGFDLVHGELWIGVELFVDADEAGELCLDLRGKLLSEIGRCGCEQEESGEGWGERFHGSRCSGSNGGSGA